MSISIEQITSKKLTVGIVGLGYVGYPLSLAFAEAGVSVLGFDIDEKKINLLNQGKGFIRHIPQSRLEAVKDHLSATNDEYKHENIFYKHNTHTLYQ